MANTKGYAVRQVVIDRCLHSERGYSVSEMMDRCNRELEERGLQTVSAMNTIRDDMSEIENTYHVRIEMLQSGRNKRYRYVSRSFSIYKAPLSENDLANLQEAMQALTLYQGRPQFEWLAEVSVHISNILMCNQQGKQPIVGFDDNAGLKGLEWFDALFNAINNHQALTLEYRSFRQEQSAAYTVHPYYLKQYNNRWFLLAEIDSRDGLSNFALDRIVNVEYSHVAYKPNNGQYNFAEYFDDIIGVSHPNNAAREDVVLRVSRSLFPYIETKPLHHSQTIVESCDWAVTIRINVVSNYELEQLILSYCEGIEVLSPATLREKIASRIRKSAEKYDTFSSSEPIASTFASENKV